MTDIEIRQMPVFKKAYKKLPAAFKNYVNEAVLTIINNPQIGEEKRGDLAGIYVHKFKIHQQHFLLAYEWNLALRLLLALGVHENFHGNLKRK